MCKVKLSSRQRGNYQAKRSVVRGQIDQDYHLRNFSPADSLRAIPWRVPPKYCYLAPDELLRIIFPPSWDEKCCVPESLRANARHPRNNQKLTWLVYVNLFSMASQNMSACVSFVMWMNTWNNFLNFVSEANKLPKREHKENCWDVFVEQFLFS